MPGGCELADHEEFLQQLPEIHDQFDIFARGIMHSDLDFITQDLYGEDGQNDEEDGQNDGEDDTQPQGTENDDEIANGTMNGGDGGDGGDGDDGDDGNDGGDGGDGCDGGDGGDGGGGDGGDGGDGDIGGGGNDDGGQGGGDDGGYGGNGGDDGGDGGNGGDGGGDNNSVSTAMVLDRIRLGGPKVRIQCKCNKWLMTNTKGTGITLHSCRGGDRRKFSLAMEHSRTAGTLCAPVTATADVRRTPSQRRNAIRAQRRRAMTKQAFTEALAMQIKDMAKPGMTKREFSDSLTNGLQLTPPDSSRLPTEQSAPEHEDTAESGSMEEEIQGVMAAELTLPEKSKILTKIRRHIVNGDC
jgi:hypothetical protein